MKFNAFGIDDLRPSLIDDLCDPHEMRLPIPEQLTENDAKLLERAAEKLVRYGEQVGVTPEKMISLLDAGISIRELLIFLASNDAANT